MQSPNPDPANSDVPNPDVNLPRLHDATIRVRKHHAGARVEAVPPEEFGIARNARNIRDCNYCFHEVARRESDLIAAGYDADQVRALPGRHARNSIETIARDTVDESRGGAGDDGIKQGNREILVTEHFIRMDYEGNGKPALYRVTTGGDDGEILKRNGEEEIVREDVIPFAAMTPVIVTHRFFGRSIADLVMDIQRIKTALLRGALDNLYLHNNPRVEVAEAYANESTIDDLLVSRPGGIVRTRQPGGLNWQLVPDITGSVYPALQYFDAVREWRTGGSRQGQGVDPNALQNQVATIANQMADAAQAKTKLVARIFAETGIRDLFSLLHGVIRRNGSQADTVRLRNQWVEVDPRDWKERHDMTINVGLGTGSKAQQLAQVMSVIALQREALAAGKDKFVSDENSFNAAREVTRLVGLRPVDRFFTDPRTMPATAETNVDPEPSLIEIQLRAVLEKLRADLAVQARKLEGDMTLAQQKFALDKELKLLDAQLKREQQQQALAAKIVAGAESAGEPCQACEDTGATGEGVKSGVAAGALTTALMEVLRQITAPKRIVKNADGSYTTQPVG